jgi:Uma2 family endonuclease
MQLVLPDKKGPQILGIEPAMDDDRYFEFCQENPNLRIERTAEGKIVIMPPVGLESSDHELEVGTQLRIWAKRDGRGRAFGASAAYILPSRAAYAPDASWVSYSQLAKLSKDEKSKFPHLVPEFIVEVRSPSDRLPRVKAKMQEWIDNGVQLAWFIDGNRHSVTIYRPAREPEELIHPDVVAGEGPVKGFRLKMADIWAGL